jgi:hypothetical protein
MGEVAAVKGCPKTINHRACAAKCRLEYCCTQINSNCVLQSAALCMFIFVLCIPDVRICIWGCTFLPTKGRLEATKDLQRTPFQAAATSTLRLATAFKIQYMMLMTLVFSTSSDDVWASFWGSQTRIALCRWQKWCIALLRVFISNLIWREKALNEHNLIRAAKMDW